MYLDYGVSAMGRGLYTLRFLVISLVGVLQLRS